MPAATTSRQPGAPSWFSSAEARRLLSLERRWLLQRLSSLPLAPCLWVEPTDAMEALPSPLRGLLLYRAGPGYAGSVRCGLPLPLASGCLGAIVLQHVARPELLDEAARLLADSGRLWICGLTPWSPYRWRWHGDARADGSPGGWRRRLQAAGLQPGTAHYLGPRWRDRPGAGDAASGVSGVLRAGYVIEAEKRAALPVAPAPLRWQGSAARAR